MRVVQYGKNEQIHCSLIKEQFFSPGVYERDVKIQL